MYPLEARNSFTEGIVFTKFTVAADGEINNIRVIKSIGNGLDEEAVRVISRMPHWQPAIQNGELISTEYSLPITFILEGEKMLPPPPPHAPSQEEELFLKKALYIINGKEMTFFDFETLVEKGELRTKRVLDIKNALNKYGEKGKNGVVEVTINNYKSPEYERFGFPGGIEAMEKFITANLKYPESAKRAKIEGFVEVLFTVEKSGEIKDIKVKKGIGFGCDEEALRIIAAMPKWNPAHANGNAVDQSVIHKVEFKLK